ncbi:AsmA family protein [Martelella soudanensis]|uniref:AsmA family protein n=1 Tax=unclassified Martelella TaxID=2629616 RepID=UPI0015DE2EC6|nr:MULTISPECIES: AsmA-like C-terminal region-containing protein [unclassified Martelella]
MRYGLAGGILLAVAVYHLVPTIVSPVSMRGALEEALSGWLGAQASIAGAPEISYWPRPRVTAHGAAVARPDGGGLLVYGNAAELTADFGIFGALSGNPAFSDLTLDKAVVVLEDAGAPGAAPANRLATAVAAIQDGQADAINGKGPGELRLSNSTIAIAGDGDPRIVKAVTGKLDWEELDGAARFTGSAEIGGEPTEISLRTAKPATLLAGGSSTVDLTLANALASVSYQGSASGRMPYVLNGSFSLSTADLQNLLTTLGVETRFLSTVGQASLKGQVARSGSSLRFSPVELAIGDARGSGALDIELQTPEEPARISATMAFTDIALFDAQSSLPSWIDTMADGSDDETGQPLSDLDLRVSAGTVRLADITLSDVAASIIRTSEQTSFDIADSRLDNGTLYGHVAVRNEGTAKVRLNAENVRSGPLFRQLGFAVPLESNALDLELIYQAALPLQRDAKDGLSGSFRFSAGQGQLTWLDLNAILETAANSNAFAFSPLKQAPYAFRSIKGRGTLDGTMLTLEGVTIESENRQVTIDGRIDTASGQLEANLTAIPKNGTSLSLDISGNALAAFARVTEMPPKPVSE